VGELWCGLGVRGSWCEGGVLWRCHWGVAGGVVMALVVALGWWGWWGVGFGFGGGEGGVGGCVMCGGAGRGWGGGWRWGGWWLGWWGGGDVKMVVVRQAGAGSRAFGGLVAGIRWVGSGGVGGCGGGLLKSGGMSSTGSIHQDHYVLSEVWWGG